MAEGSRLCTDIEKVISIEKSGREFYMKCAAKTTNQVGRGMFESFAKCCRINQEKMERMYGSYYKKEYSEYLKKPGKTLEDIFSANLLTGALDERDKILEALKHALRGEEENSAAYRNLTEETSDKTLKKFFHGLADEKAKHVQLMQMHSAYVEGTGSYAEYK